MDLLGGYGSDDSSKSSSSKSSSSSPPRPAVPPPRTQTQLQTYKSSGNDHDGDDGKREASSNVAGPTAGTTTTKTTTMRSSSTALNIMKETTPTPTLTESTNTKQRKKVLSLSLNAVLPPHILQRLTKQRVVNANDADDDDSSVSSSEQDDEKKLNNRDSTSNGKQEQQPRPKRNSTAKSNEITSLLRDLGRYEAGKGSSSNGENDNNHNASSEERNEGKEDENLRKRNDDDDNNNKVFSSVTAAASNPVTTSDKQGKERDKLGFSFMSVKTEVIKRRPRGSTKSGTASTNANDDSVIDIHAATYVDRQKMKQQQQYSMDNQHCKETKYDYGDVDDKEQEETTTITTVEDKSSASTAIPSTNTRNTILRRPQQDTTIRASARSVRPNNEPQPPSTETEPFPSSMSSSIQHPTQSLLNSRKRRRDIQQELLRATKEGRDTSQLLASSFGGQDGTDATSSNVIHLQQTNVPEYHLDAGEHSQAIMANKLRGKAHHVSVKMYDPKAGDTLETKGQISLKNKQHHQINQLAANAYNLEASLLVAKNNNPSNKRANSKQKYGW